MDSRLGQQPQPTVAVRDARCWCLFVGVREKRKKLVVAAGLRGQLLGANNWRHTRGKGEGRERRKEEEARRVSASECEGRSLT